MPQVMIKAEWQLMMEKHRISMDEHFFILKIPVSNPV